jgi:hypothetical protein
VPGISVLAPVACAGATNTCLSWGFETGTTDTEGWVKDNRDPTIIGNNFVTNITVSTSRVHSGAGALAVSITVGLPAEQTTHFVNVRVPLCASGGSINLAGYTFSAQAWFRTTAGAIPGNAPNFLQVYDDSVLYLQFPVDGTNTENPTTTPAVPGRWVPIRALLAETASFVGINIQFPVTTSDSWSGVMFLDDIQITPP